MRAWRLAYLVSTQVCGIGLSGLTEVSVRGEYGKDGWVPSGGVAPLSW